MSKTSIEIDNLKAFRMKCLKNDTSMHVEINRMVDAYLKEPAEPVKPIEKTLLLEVFSKPFLIIPR